MLHTYEVLKAKYKRFRNTSEYLKIYSHHCNVGGQWKFEHIVQFDVLILQHILRNKISNIILYNSFIFQDEIVSSINQQSREKLIYLWKLPTGRWNNILKKRKYRIQSDENVKNKTPNHNKKIMKITVSKLWNWWIYLISGGFYKVL